MIYLDNAASTRPYDEVIDVLDEYQRSVYANPSAARQQKHWIMPVKIY